MNMREYLLFLLVGFAAFFIGGLITQAIGLSGGQNIAAQVLAILIPLTIFYLVLKQLRLS